MRTNDAKASPIEGKDEIVTERGKDMRDFDWEIPSVTPLRHTLYQHVFVEKEGRRA